MNGSVINDSYINTTDQLADILMKTLGRVKFHELCARIGMVQINSSLICKDRGELLRAILAAVSQ